MPAPAPHSPIDAVDAADQVVGTVLRGEVFRRQAGFRVVHVFLFDGQGNLLLQQLARGRSRNPLRWGSSVAGYLHVGEDYPAGAKRRLGEELGLDLELVKHGSIWMDDRGCRKFITLYLATAGQGRPVISEPDHIEQLEWLSIPSLEVWLSRSPDEFTETFRHVYSFYRNTDPLISGS